MGLAEGLPSTPLPLPSLWRVMSHHCVSVRHLLRFLPWVFAALPWQFPCLVCTRIWFAFSLGSPAGKEIGYGESMPHAGDLISADSTLRYGFHPLGHPLVNFMRRVNLPSKSWGPNCVMTSGLIWFCDDNTPR